MAQFPAHSLALLLGARTGHYLSIRTLLYFSLSHKRKRNTCHKKKSLWKIRKYKEPGAKHLFGNRRVRQALNWHFCFRSKLPLFQGKAAGSLVWPKALKKQANKWCWRRESPGALANPTPILLPPVSCFEESRWQSFKDLKDLLHFRCQRWDQLLPARPFSKSQVTVFFCAGECLLPTLPTSALIYSSYGFASVLLI